MISIITPTYNRGPALTDTLRSAIRQTCANVEFIVVDDCSTENAAEHIAALSTTSIQLIRHDQNRGVSAALNTGICAARGEFVAILEHDDVWLPQKLEKQLPLFDDPAVGLVYCGVAMVDEQGHERSRFVPHKRGDIYRDLLFKSHIPTSSAVVVRRECFDKVGLFDESLQGPQDYDMWIRIARHYRVDFVPDVLVHFAAYEHERLNSPSRLAPMHQRLTGKFQTYDYPSSLFKQRVLAYRHYTLAGMYGVSGRRREARAAYRRSLGMWPLNLKSWAGLAATYTGPVGYRTFAQAKTRLLQMMHSQGGDR